MTRFSILIPSYRRPAMLRQTLASVAAQTALGGDVEVVISDDSPTAETRAEVEAFRDGRGYVRTFEHVENLGGPGNWSFLLDQARGEFVFLLSHDDAIPPDFLATYLALIRERPRLDLVFGDIELRSPDFRPLTVLSAASPEGPADGPSRCRDQLLSHHMVMATAYRRSTLVDAGGWDARVGSHLDCTAFCRSAVRARETYRVARPLLFFRISAGSWGHDQAKDQRQLAVWYRRKLDLLRDDARSLAPDLLPLLDTMYGWHARTVLIYLETELGTRHLDGPSARAAMRSLLDVFPEGRHDRVAWKLWLASHLGTGWLRLARRLTGRPDPYQSSVALFNSFPA